MFDFPLLTFPLFEFGLFLLKLDKMRVKARVSCTYQLLVKSLLIGPDLVPRNQQDRSPFWVKRKGNSPLPIIAVKSELLHIRVL
jgi:hypothetical protein